MVEAHLLSVAMLLTMVLFLQTQRVRLIMMAQQHKLVRLLPMVALP